MIIYKRGCRHLMSKIFQLRGSVFPQSFAIALPVVAITVLLKMSLQTGGVFEKLGLEQLETQNVLTNNAIWSGFTFLVGFLVVFRTSQAYSRYWDGCTATHQMRAQWFETCSSLVAFCRYNTNADPQQVQTFQHLLIRLFSLLHATALGEIEETSSQSLEGVEAFRYPLLDVRAVDRESLKSVMDSDCKVELLLQWIQQLIVDNMNTGVLTIPAPLLSRSFQELFNGIQAFQQAIKIATIPLPFPYSQMCDILLVMHWLGTPVITCQWVTSPFWAGLFSFIQVFIYWSLNMIAMEIENPFGHDPNDIDGQVLQAEMNRNLFLLVEPCTKRTPTLRDSKHAVQVHSMMDVWLLDAMEANTPFRPQASARNHHSPFLRRADTRGTSGTAGSKQSFFSNLNPLKRHSSGSSLTVGRGPQGMLGRHSSGSSLAVGRGLSYQQGSSHALMSGVTQSISLGSGVVQDPKEKQVNDSSPRPSLVTFCVDKAEKDADTKLDSTGIDVDLQGSPQDLEAPASPVDTCSFEHFHAFQPPDSRHLDVEWLADGMPSDRHPDPPCPETASGPLSRMTSHMSASSNLAVSRDGSTSMGPRQVSAGAFSERSSFSPTRSIASDSVRSPRAIPEKNNVPDDGRHLAPTRVQSSMSASAARRTLAELRAA